MRDPPPEYLQAVLNSINCPPRTADVHTIPSSESQTYFRTGPRLLSNKPNSLQVGSCMRSSKTGHGHGGGGSFRGTMFKGVDCLAEPSPPLYARNIQMPCPLKCFVGAMYIRNNILVPAGYRTTLHTVDSTHPILSVHKSHPSERQVCITQIQKILVPPNQQGPRQSATHTQHCATG